MARMLYLGDDVTLPGTGYPPLAAFQTPFPSSLRGAFFLGNGKDIAVRNWAGGDDATIVGDPIFSDSHARFSGDGYLQTAVAETLAASIFVVGREDVADATGWVGNFQGGANIGLALYTQGASSSIQSNVGRAGGTGGSLGVTSDTTAWNIYGLTVPATGPHTLRNFATGGKPLSNATADRELNGVGPLRIGRLLSPSHIGSVNIAAVLIYNRALNDGEADTVAEFLQAYAAGRGINIDLA